MTMMIWIALGVSGFILGSYVIAIYNNLIATKHDVDRAWANIDVLLKQRHDELPKLIHVVESYMQYEQETLKQVIEARSRYAQASSFEQKNKLDNELARGMMGIIALAENYPELKANVQFQELQGRISKLEESIADRREFYNASVNAWNVHLESIPEIFFARLLAFRARELYRVEESERADVKMNLKLPSRPKSA